MSTTASVTGASTRTLESMQQTERNSKATLDKDSFMKLLIEQMSNQDPLSPTTDTEFIAQLAQFSMLEQMQSMNETSSMQQVYALVGKNVTIATTDSDGNDAAVSGKVDSAFWQNNTGYVVVGGVIYPTSDVLTVNADADKDPASDLTNQAGLLGMLAGSSQTGADGNAISGAISKLITRDGVTYALINGTEVPLSSLTELSAN